MKLVMDRTNVRKELRKLRKSNSWTRIEKMLMHIAEQPYEGAEKARYASQRDVPVWIKKLDYHNRVLYTIDLTKQQVDVVSVGGHYANMGKLGGFAS